MGWLSVMCNMFEAFNRSYKIQFILISDAKTVGLGFIADQAKQDNVIMV